LELEAVLVARHDDRLRGGVLHVEADVGAGALVSQGECAHAAVPALESGPDVHLPHFARVLDLGRVLALHYECFAFVVPPWRLVYQAHGLLLQLHGRLDVHEAVRRALHDALAHPVPLLVHEVLARAFNPEPPRRSADPELGLERDEHVEELHLG